MLICYSEAMLHYLGLVIILCTWAAGLYMLWVTHDASLQTISKHAVTSIKMSLLFGFTLILIGALCYWWVRFWLQPHLDLPPIFTTLLNITIALEIGIGLFPDRSGWVRQVHSFAAYGMAVLLIPLALIITLSSRLHTVVQITCALLLLYMLASFTIIVLMRRVRSRYLFFQVMYLVAFDLIILCAGYLPTK